MDEYIFNETPSGLIDGVNKTFTTLHNISKIEDVYVGFAPYRNVSFVGNVITLGFAPPVGAIISVDYFKAGITPTPVTSDVTLGDVIDDVYEKIGQQRVNNKVYKESQIKLAITAGLERIRNQRTYKNVIKSYSFNKAKDFTAMTYNPSYVQIGEDYNYIPTSGVAIIDNSVMFEYTSYAAGRLNGVAGIVYKEGAKVSVGYKVPTLVKKVSEVMYNGTALEYRDVRDYTMNGKYYTLVRNSLGEQFIILPYTRSEAIITVSYIPFYTAASSDSDLLDIEWEYYELLSYYALWKIFEDREDDRADRMARRYTELLREYKSYKSRAVDGIKNKLKNNIRLGVE